MPPWRRLWSARSTRGKATTGLAIGVVACLAVVTPLTLGSGSRGTTTRVSGVAPGPAPTSVPDTRPGPSRSTSTVSVAALPVKVVPVTSSPLIPGTIAVATPTDTTAPSDGSGPRSSRPTTSTTAPAGPPTTAPGALTWRQESVPAGASPLNAVSCPDASHCWAVGAGVVATADGGAHWAIGPAPSLDAHDELVGVSCVDDADCWVASRSGRIFRSGDGGATWSEQTVPVQGAGRAGLDSITCLSLVDCWAVGGGTGWVAYTVDGGTNWSAASVCDNCTLSTISCPDATHCWAGGGTPGATAGAGGGPGAGPAGPADPAVYSSGDGGVSWWAQNLPASAPGPVTGISCTRAEDCTAVGGAAGTPGLLLSTTDGGTTWSESSLPPGTGPYAGVSCVSSGDCLAVGASGAAAGGTVIGRSGVGAGAAWTAQYQDRSGSFASVDCVDSGPCWVAGSSVWARLPG